MPKRLFGRGQPCFCVFSNSLVVTTLPKKDGKFVVTIEFKFVDIVATFFDEES